MVNVFLFVSRRGGEEALRSPDSFATAVGQVAKPTSISRKVKRGRELSLALEGWLVVFSYDRTARV
jgi:hypothetical protein